MKVSVKVQQLGQIVFCRRADNGFGHVLIPRIIALEGYYQKPSNCFRQAMCGHEERLIAKDLGQEKVRFG
jgi:hypothetical protein